MDPPDALPGERDGPGGEADGAGGVDVIVTSVARVSVSDKQSASRSQASNSPNTSPSPLFLKPKDTDFIKFTPKSTLMRLMQREKEEMENTDSSKKNFQLEMTQKKEKTDKLLETDLAVLKKGAKLLKIPHRGKPKQSTVYVSSNDDGDYICYWSSKTKSRSQCTFVLKECGLYLGQGQGLFKKRNMSLEPGEDVSAHSRLSFSLVTETRTVDMMAPNGDSYERWLRVFKYCGTQIKTAENEKDADKPPK